MIRLLLIGIFLVLFLLLSLPLLIYLIHKEKKESGAALKKSTAIVRWAFRVILFLAGTDIEARGEKELPTDEAVLYVGNHRSYFDIVSTYTLLRQPAGFIAKKEMERIPILSAWMYRIGCLMLDRSDAKEGLKTILTAIERIKGGTSMFIYPEGTRNENGDPLLLMDFHEGSMKIAQKAGCRIVPVAIYGTDDIFERHVPFIRKKHVIISFGKPFYSKDIPEEYKKKQGAYVRGLIIDMLEEITAGDDRP